MATTQRRTSAQRPYFHADDFVSAKLYDRDREADDRWREDMSDKLDKIAIQLSMIVPREEHTRVWAENDRRFSVLEQKVDVNYRDLENKLNGVSMRTGNQFLTSATNQYQALIYVICAVIGGVAGHFLH